jgi:hypothetical protein
MVSSYVQNSTHGMTLEMVRRIGENKIPVPCLILSASLLSHQQEINIQDKFTQLSTRINIQDFATFKTSYAISFYITLIGFILGKLSQA